MSMFSVLIGALCLDCSRYAPGEAFVLIFRINRCTLCKLGQISVGSGVMLSNSTSSGVTTISESTVKLITDTFTSAASSVITPALMIGSASATPDNGPVPTLASQTTLLVKSKSTSVLASSSMKPSGTDSTQPDLRSGKTTAIIIGSILGGAVLIFCCIILGLHIMWLRRCRKVECRSVGRRHAFEDVVPNNISQTQEPLDDQMTPNFDKDLLRSLRSPIHSSEIVGAPSPLSLNSNLPTSLDSVTVDNSIPQGCPASVPPPPRVVPRLSPLVTSKDAKSNRRMGDHDNDDSHNEQHRNESAQEAHRAVHLPEACPAEPSSATDGISSRFRSSSRHSSRRGSALPGPALNMPPRPSAVRPPTPGRHSSMAVTGVDSLGPGGGRAPLSPSPLPPGNAARSCSCSDVQFGDSWI